MNPLKQYHQCCKNAGCGKKGKPTKPIKKVSLKYKVDPDILKEEIERKETKKKSTKNAVINKKPKIVKKEVKKEAKKEVKKETKKKIESDPYYPDNPYIDLYINKKLIHKGESEAWDLVSLIRGVNTPDGIALRKKYSNLKFANGDGKKILDNYIKYKTGKLKLKEEEGYIPTGEKMILFASFLREIKQKKS